MILASIKYATKSIEENMMHIALSINICKTRSLYINKNQI